MNTVTLLLIANIFFTVGISIFLLIKSNYITSYLKEKGKFHAMREDISNITKTVEHIKTRQKKELEVYKSKISNSNLIFEKKLESYWELMNILDKNLPQSHITNNLDNDKFLIIYNDSDKIKRLVCTFYFANKIFLSTETKDKIKELIAILFASSKCIDKRSKILNAKSIVDLLKSSLSYLEHDIRSLGIE